MFENYSYTCAACGYGDGMHRSSCPVEMQRDTSNALMEAITLLKKYEHVMDDDDQKKIKEIENQVW